MKLNLKRTAIIAALSVFGTLFPAPADAANFLGVFFKIYGRASQIFPISIEDGTTTKWYVGTDFAAGDCKISQDGGALASTTNLPVQISGNQYTWTITAAEMATHVILITCTDVSATAWKDFAFRIETILNVGQIVADYTDGPGNDIGFVIRGNGSSGGVEITGGATGPGVQIHGGASGGATADALSIEAFGNANGVNILGKGTGHGVAMTGGATGDGLLIHGGATSGDGIGLAAIGSGHGMNIIGVGTGNGMSVVGGNTSGAGFYAAGGTGGYGANFAGNGAAEGIRAKGGLTGFGGKFVGGDTSGDGIAFVATGSGNGMSTRGVGTGNGIATVGGTTGYGFSATGTTAVLGHNLFEVPYTDITGAPVADTTTVREAMGGLMARFYNKVTQTATLQSIFKTDSVTTATTCVTSDDGTTQTKGKCN